MLTSARILPLAPPSAVLPDNRRKSTVYTPTLPSAALPDNRRKSFVHTTALAAAKPANRGRRRKDITQHPLGAAVGVHARGVRLHVRQSSVA